MTAEPAPSSVAPLPGQIDQIESLVVVAGASCAGKTTFIREIKRGRSELVPADLGIGNWADFEFHNAIELGSRLVALARAGGVVLHYDIFRPLTFFGCEDFSVDPSLLLLGRARKLSVLTLWEPPHLLWERSEARRRRLWKKAFPKKGVWRFKLNYSRYRSAKTRRETMRPVFGNARDLWSHYDRWFDYCEHSRISNHWLVNPSAGWTFSYLGRGRPQAPLWPIG